MKYTSWQSFQGWMAYRHNLGLDKNPHRKGSWEHDDWAAGWKACETENRINELMAEAA